MRHDAKTARFSIAVHIVHLDLGILHQVIVRKLNAVEIAVLKHDVILPQASRGNHRADEQQSDDNSVSEYLFHIYSPSVNLK